MNEKTVAGHDKPAKVRQRYCSKHKTCWEVLLAWARKRKGRVIGGRELVYKMEKFEAERAETLG